MKEKNEQKDYFKVINLCFLCVYKKDFLPFFRHRVGGCDYGDPDKIFTVLNFVMGHRCGVNILQLFGDKARGLCFGNLVLAKQVAVGQGGGAGRRGWCCKVL